MREPSVATAILDGSSAQSLCRMARVCRTVAHAVAYYMNDVFDINRTLLRYFEDPTAFRCLQARTATLISGPTALSFFSRRAPAGVLELYVHFRHRREVARWLLEHGYQFSPAPQQDANFELAASQALSANCGPPIAGVETAPSQVKVIVANNTPIEVILGFHHTGVMNVISYERAYCLFAHATLEARVSLRSSSCRGQAWGDGEDTLEHNFQLLKRLPDIHHHLRPSFHLGSRWLDDAASWVLPLNTRGITAPPLPNPKSSPLSHDPSSVCNWEVRHTLRDGVVMHYEVVKSELLRYRYLVTEPDTANSLATYLDTKRKKERFKLNAEQDIWRFHDANLGHNGGALGRQTVAKTYFDLSDRGEEGLAHYGRSGVVTSGQGARMLRREAGRGSGADHDPPRSHGTDKAVSISNTLLPTGARVFLAAATCTLNLLRASMDPQKASAQRDEDVNNGASSIDTADLAAWFEAKRRFREAGYRIVSQTMLQASVFVANSSFRNKWSCTNRTILTPTMCRRRTMYYAWSTPMLASHCSSPRFIFYRALLGRVSTSGSIPFEDLSSILPDAIPSLSLALKMNKDQLKLQSDAIGIVLSYLQEERRVLEEKHAAWITNSSSIDTCA
ncbi:hypothetical protein C8Q76DRAFT_688605 [Earliella scabrosa]|nr:hypothetical protein C8Q76DRAFT_688605 [Earliella scabrosa]